MGIQMNTSSTFAIIISLTAAIIAYLQAKKQIQLSIDQSEVGNYLTMVDKRIELYMFLSNLEEMLKRYSKRRKKKQMGLNTEFE